MKITFDEFLNEKNNIHVPDFTKKINGIKLDFKKFYINGNRFSFYVIYRGKTHRFEFEGTWNTFMLKLTDFANARYIVKEEKPYFVVYKKPAFSFSPKMIEKWMDKENAIKRMKELNRSLNESVKIEFDELFEGNQKRNARIVMTFKCNRDCKGCCNKIMNFEHTLAKVEEIKNYQKVFITGGEPMLYPDKLIEIIRILRKNGNKRILLYTAWPYPKEDFLRVLKELDGVTLTLHAHTDRYMFLDNGYDKMKFPGKEMRLKAFSVKNFNVEGDWKVIPTKWISDCPMPPEEDLFVLSEY